MTHEQEKPTENLNSWTRRRFIGTAGVAAIGLGVRPARAAGPNGDNAAGLLGIAKDASGFALPDLPYAAGALEPHIDAKTMTIHHGRHHAGYTRKLNAALEKLGSIGPLSIEHVLAGVSRLPAAVRTDIRNNGGGYYNHSLFWGIMSPEGGGEPGGKVAKAIRKEMGSFASLREAFSRASLNRFGSGWAWLVVQDDGSLAVGSTPNQDNPLMVGVAELRGTPILGLDVWEHAYYLKYQNRRADYIDAWWNTVNWEMVDRLYAQAVA